MHTHCVQILCEAKICTHSVCAFKPKFAHYMCAFKPKFGHNVCAFELKFGHIVCAFKRNQEYVNKICTF